MNKYEFLAQLRNALSSVPPEEREAAMSYYEEFFSDAGEENEQAVIAGLGSPEELAQSIIDENRKDAAGAADAPTFSDTSDFDTNHITPSPTRAQQVSNIKNIKVNFDCGEVIIKTGDVDEIKVDTKNVIQERFHCETKGDTLTVDYDRSRHVSLHVSFFGRALPDAKIEIIIPETMVFENVDISNGAGKMTVTGITADNFIIGNGVGEIIMNNVTANNKLDIEGGVGAITVNNATCGAIDAATGVGQLTFTGEVNGDGSIASGIGAVYMTLYGDRDDYDFRTESGIGQITTPGANSSGKYTFRISSGIGEVKITMKQK